MSVDLRDACTHWEDERHRSRTFVGCGCDCESCTGAESESRELDRLGAPRVGQERRIVQPDAQDNGQVGIVISRYLMDALDAEETESQEGIWVTLSLPPLHLRKPHRRRKKEPRRREWMGHVTWTAPV
ncbi:hypothetical protein [Streptomyces sp. NPDC047108]|uniref:hypothetical protein n=1 Tax=Streptomyces sp. NPDC047108 TaxID=3155025 RepID=UPI0033C1E129